MQLSSHHRDHAESVYAAALKVAGRFARKYPRLRDEFLSEAGMVACRSALNFDPSRGAQPATHAKNRAAGACLDVLKANPQPDGTFRRPMPLEDAESEDDRMPVGWEAESEDEVRGMTAGLPCQIRESVRRKYLHAETHNMLLTSQAMGVSEAQISFWHKEARERIRTKGVEQR